MRIPSFPMDVNDVTYQAEIAVCEQFHLGYEDHGIFTAQATFGNGTWVQGMPGYCLDSREDGTEYDRIGTAYGCQFIIELIKVLGSPEQAKGNKVVVLRDRDFDAIKGIASVNDKGEIGEPFLFADLRARFHADAQ